MGKKSRTRGFTLVEMLVVVTIIAILVTMMVMGMQTAVRSAKKAKCQNYEHEIVSAILQFESEHGCFPGWKNTLNGKPVSWVVMILDYIDQHQLWTDYLKGATPAAPYIPLLICPSANSMAAGSTTYEVNSSVIADRSSTSTIVTRSNLVNPSTTPLLYETTNVKSWTSATAPTALTMTSIKSGTGSGGPPSPNVKSGHIKGANVGYCDGHVEFIQN
jgi:prepilin-type N-terminal cleavage/methylation domain-containing protein/prepilin-type processing-associated H-X9-DG protein